MTSCDLEKSFIFEKTVEIIISHVCSSTHHTILTFPKYGS